jgi:alpha,alpha-trehalase
VSLSFLFFFLQMFEKFSIRDVDSAGRGGEYTVQAGFGWTNGVLLWIASMFGDKLVVPVCPDPLFASTSSGSSPNNGKNGTPQRAVAPRVVFGPALIAAALQLQVV